MAASSFFSLSNRDSVIVWGGGIQCGSNWANDVCMGESYKSVLLRYGILITTDCKSISSKGLNIDGDLFKWGFINQFLRLKIANRIFPTH